MTLIFFKIFKLRASGMKVRLIFRNFPLTQDHLHDFSRYSNARNYVIKTQGAGNFMETLVKILVFEIILEFEKNNFGLTKVRFSLT